MSKNGSKEKLQKVKLTLAAKYESLARIAGSATKRKEFLHNADKYRGQAARLAGH